MANLSEDIQCAGSDTRPPMLDRTDFASWQQRPFQMGTIRDPIAEGTKGLPKDIYTLINHYTKAKDIWDNVKMLLEGSELTKEDRESQLYDDFEHFRQNKGETIHDYYVWFAKFINDMRNIKMTMSRMQLNSKFINNMLHEWGRFITAAKLNRSLKDSNYDQLVDRIEVWGTMHLDQVQLFKGGAQNIVENAKPGPSKERHINVYETATDNRVALDEEQLLFIASRQDTAVDEDVDEKPVQDLALNLDNVFQADDCDAFDSDVMRLYCSQTMFHEHVKSTKHPLDPILLKCMLPRAVVQARCLELEAKLSKLKDKIQKDDHNELVKCFSNLEFWEKNEKVKNHYKELYDSIKITRAKHIKQTTTLSTKNENLKAQIHENLKCITMDSVKPRVLAPGRYVIDVEPLPPRIRNNREAHLDYLNHLKESVETLREIIEEARVERPIDRSLAYACLYTKHSQELLEYAIGTCPKDFNTQDKKHAITSLNKKKRVTFEDQCETSNNNTQKHVEQLNIQKTKVPVIPSTGINSCTNASGYQPRRNTKKNRISPTKSDNKKKVEEHPRMNKSSQKKSNRSNSSISLSVLVYYVEGLGHNLFSVRQFCDSDLEVAFRKHSCYVRDTDGVELINGSRGSNLYTISVKTIMESHSQSVCYPKRSQNNSWL
ncbi:hypothetical protein Tco_1067724 [Tanacetum coccineum]|uniref:Integrase, catalytic region, zinc finger, CCHC-type, peptidase aspartic, catalytic n=1 Tax=Tanacetum coccineum TaxID=301880 RepID=A0ABQ5HFD2_9ASTR